MANWTFKCYDDGRSPNLWQRWYDDNARARGAHDAILDIIEQLERWREPYTKAFDDVVEIRFTAQKVERRIFGFYGGTKQQFVVTATGSHKGKVYTPKEILKTHSKRRKEIEGDPTKAKDCSRPEAKEVPG